MRRRLTTEASLVDDADLLDCWRNSMIESDICQSSSLQCTSGAIGPLCGGCDTGFFYSTTDLLCHPCSAPVLATVILLVVGLFLVVIIGALYTGLLRIPVVIRQTWVYGALSRLDSGTFRVVWSNYQV